MFAAAKPQKFAAISGATSGDNTVIAAVTARKIRVLALYLVPLAAVTVRFESKIEDTLTAASGVMSLAEKSVFVLPFNEAGWFETLAGAILNMELGGAVQVSGGLVYQEVL